MSNETGLFSVRVLTLGANSKSLVETTLPNGVAATDWSADGEWILVSGESQLRAVPANRSAAPMVVVNRTVQQTRFSPDRHWIAYTSDESRTSEVYVQTFPSGDQKTRISTEGEFAPEWRGDGRELFYLTPAGTLMWLLFDRDGYSKPDGQHSCSQRRSFRAVTRVALPTTTSRRTVSVSS